MAENETSKYIFFIFDDNVMQQSEYDDIEEAILFYQPKASYLESDDKQIYLLFGHIVGIVKCTQTLTGALPCTICLERTRFAVVQNTHYLLFLGYDNVANNNIPDLYIKKQLKKFLDVFAFYHGSFERFISTHQNDMKDVLLHLELICSNYLAFAQGYDVPIQSIFDPLPTITFDRTNCSIFAKVAQIIEACQRIENVYCGCLFAESRIITSQISSELVHHLLLLKANQKNNHVSVFYPGFDLPFGVRILQVYVSQEQYKEIIKVSSHSPYFKMNTNVCGANDCKGDLKLTNDRDGQTISNSSLISSKEESDESIGTKSVTDIPSLASEILNSGYSREVIIPHLSRGRTISSSVVETVNFSEDTHLLVQDKAGPIRHDADDVDYNDVLKEDNMITSIGFSNDIMSSDIASKHNYSVGEDKQDIPINEDKQDIPINEEKDNSLPSNQNEVLDNMQELHLYVQAHSSIALALLMKPQKKYRYQNMRSLWEMLLPRLGELEAQVKSILSVDKENEMKDNENICYVDYDKIIDKCQTNMSDVINLDDQAFINSINTFHHQLDSSSSTSDISFIKSNLTYGYAHKSPVEEVYLQQRGNYRPCQSSPMNTEPLWRLDQQASNKLRKLTMSNILL